MDRLDRQTDLVLDNDAEVLLVGLVGDKSAGGQVGVLVLQLAVQG